MALRYELDLYACVRPCKTYEGMRTRFEKVDVVIVRENTEDLYAGIEYEANTPDAKKVIEFLNSLQDKQIREGSGISIKPMSEFGSARIIRYAFEYARNNGRKRVHCVTKSNIMKYTDGLFLAVFREIAKEYPDIEPWENLVDATCMGLIQRPEEWDVLVLPNLYGDILSDLTAGHGRRSRRRARRQHRHEGRGLRGDPRLGAEVQGPEQGQPDRDDPVRRDDAPPRRRDRRPPTTSSGRCPRSSPKARA